jgi:hypothetical protein
MENWRAASFCLVRPEVELKKKTYEITISKHLLVLVALGVPSFAAEIRKGSHNAREAYFNMVSRRCQVNALATAEEKRQFCGIGIL